MSSFDVFVHGFREGDSGVAAALMEKFGLDRTVAEVIELSAPCVVVSALPQAFLSAYRTALEECGAAVQISESEEPPREPSTVAPSLHAGAVLELPLPLAARFPDATERSSGMRGPDATQAQVRAPSVAPPPFSKRAPRTGGITLAAGTAPGPHNAPAPASPPYPATPPPPRRPAALPQAPQQAASRRPSSTDQFCQPVQHSQRPNAPGLVPQPAPKVSGPVQPPRTSPLPVEPKGLRISTEARVLAAEVADARAWRDGRRQQARGRASHPLEDGGAHSDDPEEEPHRSDPPPSRRGRRSRG